MTEQRSDFHYTPSGRLKGRVALICGAGSVGSGWGNGRAITVRFAEEGARVFGLDAHLDRLEETKSRVAASGGELASAACDVTNADSVAAAVSQCIAAFGRIDILVNCVGGSAKGGPVEMTEHVWDTQFDMNLKSVFLTCKHVLPHMVAQAGGAIVNLSSTSGIRWTGSAQIAYSAAKAGIVQFSKVLAVQYARQGIRVNTVIPGQLHTPMVETRLAGQRAGGDVQALLAQRQARIPLSFMGDGRDTAAATLFLVSDEARFITGTEILVDGGMAARCD